MLPAVVHMLFDLEKEALLASGINDDTQIEDYLEKLHFLHLQFTAQTVLADDPLSKAKQLFDWLWSVKPLRYRLHGNYRMSEVIDRQLSKKTRTVGNCLGLTLLYNCLLWRIGLKPEAVYLENAFGIGPHVLTRLCTKHSTIDIENILPDGFDYKGHTHVPMRKIWRDKELIADIYHSRGNTFFEKGHFSRSLKSYKKAVSLNPKYQKAHYNISILLDRLKTDKESGNCYPIASQ
jgi:tetratricopeptide (TPR) repeat protein